MAGPRWTRGGPLCQLWPHPFPLACRCGRPLSASALFRVSRSPGPQMGRVRGWPLQSLHPGWGCRCGPPSIAMVSWPHTGATGELGGEAQTWPQPRERRLGSPGPEELLYCFSSCRKRRRKNCKRGRVAWLTQVFLSFLPPERCGDWILFPTQP